MSSSAAMFGGLQIVDFCGYLKCSIINRAHCMEHPKFIPWICGNSQGWKPSVDVVEVFDEISVFLPVFFRLWADWASIPLPCCRVCLGSLGPLLEATLSLLARGSVNWTPGLCFIKMFIKWFHPWNMFVRCLQSKYPHKFLGNLNHVS